MWSFYTNNNRNTEINQAEKSYTDYIWSSSTLDVCIKLSLKFSSSDLWWQNVIPTFQNTNEVAAED